MNSVGNKVGRVVFNMLLCLIGVILIMIIIAFQRGDIAIDRVKGTSMENTLYKADLVISTKYAKEGKGDIVVFTGDDDIKYIKRIVGTPGDVVSITDDTLYINNEKVVENYTKSNKTPAFDMTGEVKVDKGQYFVLGDNREDSLDSRSNEMGLINKEQVHGKVVFIIHRRHSSTE